MGQYRWNASDNAEAVKERNMDMKKIILLTALILVSALPVSAAVDVEQNLINGSVEAKISITGKSKEEYVPIMVVNPNKDYISADLNMDGAAKDTFQMLKNIKTDENGNYSYSYTVTDKSGTYTLIEGNEQPQEFTIMTSAVLSEIFNTVNNASNVSEAAAVLNKYHNQLNVKWSEECSFNMNEISAGILKERPFADVNTIIQSYKRNLAANILGNKENSTKAESVLTQCCNILNIENSGIADIYNSFSDKEKKEFFGYIANAGISNYSNFEENFKEQAVLAALKNSISYGASKELLNEYQNIIKIDWSSELNGLKDVSAVYKGITGKYYANSNALLTDVRRLVKEQTNKNSSTNSGGGSGSSGGGGFVGSGNNQREGGTTITPAEPVPTSIPEQNNENEIFTDLNGFNWAKESIYKLAEDGVLNGIGNNRFAPEAPVTREQFTRAVVLAFGFTGNGDVSFNDVDKNEWYYDTICTAYTNGIIQGIDDTHFGIGEKLTREQMAVILCRAAEKSGISFELERALTFTDTDKINGYASEAVNKLCNRGIINGFEDGSFRPREICTRAQMAKVICLVRDEKK